MTEAVSAASLIPRRLRPGRAARATRRAEEKGSVQQLLGMKGAGETDDTPLWKSLGGSADDTMASGEDYAKFLTCVILSGPVLVGYTQTLNDWYDKDLDAINEPYRPIPSGRITEAADQSG
eukprot:Skav204598  [mRNA]  locus=scaffold672:209541:210811:- [translate_table: standard]